MKFLVYGVNGWIGSKVFKLLNDLNDVDVVEGNCRVDNVAELEKEIISVAPTHVISLIRRTHGTHNGTTYGTIDYLEQPGKLVENVRDNLFSPMVLSLMATKHKFHFTYLGTGCIFEYDNDHPFGEEVNGFTEKSRPNFFGSSYSVVKEVLVPVTVAELSVNETVPLKLGDVKVLFVRVCVPSNVATATMESTPPGDFLKNRLPS